jgi:uncharacterized membrane-anchored protein
LGTKNEPGAHDCYSAAGDDEPLFTLLARDPTAPHLVGLWAALRAGNITDARQIFGQMLFDPNVRAKGRDEPISEAKRAEAINCADEMRKWRRENR